MKMRSISSIIVQARWKCWLQFQKYQKMKNACIVIQSLVRGKLARIEARNRLEYLATIKIQSRYRAYLQRVSYLNNYKKIIKIQSIWRGWKGRLTAKNIKLSNSATRIQAFWRGRKQRRIFVSLRTGVVKAQNRWRCVQAYRQFRRLKKEAKEVGTLLSQINTLKTGMTAAKKEKADIEAHAMQIAMENKVLRNKLAVAETETEKKNQEIREYTELIARLRSRGSVSSPRISPLGSKTPGGQSSGPLIPVDAVPSSERERVRAKDSGGEKMKVGDVVEDVLQEEQEMITRLQNQVLSLTKERDESNMQLEKEKQLKEQVQADYHRLLRDSSQATMASTIHPHMNRLNPIPPAVRAGSQQRTLPVRATTGTRGGKPFDIVVVGPPGVGKTAMIKEFLKSENLDTQLAQLEASSACEDVTPLRFPYRSCPMLTVLDCKGSTLTRSLCKKTNWLVVIYDVSDVKTMDQAKKIVERELYHSRRELYHSRVMLFGNLFRYRKLDIDHNLASRLAELKDWAVQKSVFAMENENFAAILQALVDQLRGDAMIANSELGSSPKAMPAPLHQQDPPGGPTQSPSGGGLINAFKGFFGGTDKIKPKLMKPSMKSSSPIRHANHKNEAVAEIQLVCQLPGEFSVTCLTFGQEELHREYILLAVASKSGSLLVYKVFRTPMELEMFDLENPSHSGTGGGGSQESERVVKLNFNLI
eukprot:GHVL01034792.1.p2 GENE.GHVL01034792.1~~GHVL01034792.1.p2  ORF type:complete len:703 (+),score=148.90 GHVL01034792.1:2416-4524(+)